MLKPFAIYRNQLPVEDGYILLGHKIVIPTKLQNKILSVLHNSHQSSVKTKSTARSYVWWPQMNNDIERLIKSYISLTTETSPTKAKVLTRDYLQRPWSRLHNIIDYFGPIFGKYVFWMQVVNGLRH